jgi:hypothetical protein
MSIITDSRQINLSSASADIYFNGTSMLSHVGYDFTGLLKDEPDILFRQISVNNAQIPVSFYIINEYNNILQYSIASGPIETLIFPMGNYNATTFITTFKANMIGWNATIDKITGLFTFTYSSDFTFYDSALYRLLGFTDASASSTSHTPVHTPVSTLSTMNILTAPHLCDFSGIRKLSIRSSILRCMNRDSLTGNYTTDIQVVPVNMPAYGIIKFENISGFKNIIQNRALDQLDISIFDDKDNLVDFNGCHWNITLQLDIIRKINDDSNSSLSQASAGAIQLGLLSSLLSSINQLVAFSAPKEVNTQGGNKNPDQEDANQQDSLELPNDPSEEVTNENNDLDLLLYQKGINI